MAPEKYTLRRNEHADLILYEDGIAVEFIAASYTPLWQAIMNEMRDAAQFREINRKMDELRDGFREIMRNPK